MGEVTEAIERADMMIEKLEEKAKFVEDEQVKGHYEKDIKALVILKKCANWLIDGSMEVGGRRIV